MKKYFVTSCLFFLSISFIQAQDLIIKRSGEEIKSRVKTVASTEVEYTNFDNPDGPIYKMAKSEILLIIYSNGTKDIFNKEDKVGTTPSATVRGDQHFNNYDFFDRNVPLVYLGIDYSRCKLVGDKFENPTPMFAEINDLIAKEKYKYDVDGAVRKPNLVYQYALVNKRNSDAIESDLSAKTNETITFGDLQSIVDQYDASLIGISDGLAMVVVCECLNGIRVEGSYFYVVFDVSSKKIVLSDRLVGRAGGNGQRNYWARSVYETIKSVKDRKFGQWKLMYRRR